MQPQKVTLEVSQSKGLSRGWERHKRQTWCQRKQSRGLAGYARENMQASTNGKAHDRDYQSFYQLAHPVKWMNTPVGGRSSPRARRPGAERGPWTEAVVIDNLWELGARSCRSDLVFLGWTGARARLCSNSVPRYLCDIRS